MATRLTELLGGVIDRDQISAWSRYWVAGGDRPDWYRPELWQHLYATALLDTIVVVTGRGSYQYATGAEEIADHARTLAAIACARSWPAAPQRNQDRGFPVKLHTIGDATPGGRVVVRVGAATVSAVWRGTAPVAAGTDVDVELEVEVDAGSLRRVGADTPCGFTTDGTVTVVGQIVDPSDRDVLVLDVRPGTVMLDRPPDGGAWGVGDRIAARVRVVEVFPTGI